MRPEVEQALSISKLDIPLKERRAKILELHKAVSSGTTSEDMQAKTDIGMIMEGMIVKALSNLEIP